MAKQTFEAAIRRLEEIASLLEEGTCTLDASLKLYEESKNLLSFCQEKLKEAELKVHILSKTAEGLRLDERELD